MLVSIILPVYNAENYIDMAVQNVLNQTYTNWELILVDNCSTDSTVEKCKAWAEKDNRIITIFHAKNMGIGQSRTDGIDIAHGEYIGFIDADDYIHPQMFEIMVMVAKKNNAEIVMSNRKYISEQFTPSFEHIDLNSINIAIQNQEEIFQNMFNSSKTEGPYLVVWTKLIKSDIAKKIRITFQGGEDAYFCFKAFLMTQQLTVIDNIPLYYYVVRKTSESNSAYNFNHYMQLVVYFKMEKDTYKNNYDLYHYVSLKTYKKILCIRYDSRKSDLEQETKRLIKNEFPDFQKRFWKCKEISFLEKIEMSVLYYLPFTYKIIRR